MPILLVELMAAVAQSTVAPLPADPCRPVDAHQVASRFPSLDAYLAAREKAGTTDAPYYKRLADGRYACVVWPRLDAPPPVFTREELAQAYGFAPRR